MNRKMILIILAIVAGPPLLCGGGTITAWQASVTCQEWVYEAALFSQVPDLQQDAARRLRGYPSRSSAMALASAIALADVSETGGEQTAREALASLIIISGQDFGTGFEGSEYNYNWDPPGNGQWPETKDRVAQWVIETFGPGVQEPVPSGKESY